MVCLAGLPQEYLDVPLADEVEYIGKCHRVVRLACLLQEYLDVPLAKEDN